MKKTIVYVGSYSAESGEGIYTFELDCSCGRLTPLFDPVRAVNPSYLILNGAGNRLYAVLETQTFEGAEGGGVASFDIGGEGKPVFINSQPTYGADPCHLCIDGRNAFLFSANYGSGSFSAFPLKTNGSVGPCASVVPHTGSGPVAERQSSPHVHFTCLTPDEKDLCAVDLGTDSVLFHRVDGASGKLTGESRPLIRLKPGSGPRHMLFFRDGRFVYVLSEISSQIAVFRRMEDERYEPLQYVSTLPKGFSGISAAAALRGSPDGRFLYASNRGHNSIACFRIADDGLLAPSALFPALVDFPRDFAIDPSGRFLLAAGQNSNDLAVFRLHSETGALEPTEYRAGAHSPVCLLFREIQ